MQGPSFEVAYYTNPALWCPERCDGMTAERVQRTIDWLPSSVNSVLDAGCGSGALSNVLSDALFCVGTDRSRPALLWLNTPAVQATLERLPFARGAFDVVVATEVIEHLPWTVYQRCLREIARVANSFVLISVPYNEDLEAFRVSCPACGCRFHRTYHMRRYARANMQFLFEADSELELVRLEGISSSRRPRAPRLRRIWRSSWRWLNGSRDGFPPSAVCPQCGHSGSAVRRDAAHRQGWFSAVAKKLRGVAGRLRFVSLVRDRLLSFEAPRWWLALYARDLAAAVARSAESSHAHMADRHEQR